MPTLITLRNLVLLACIGSSCGCGYMPADPAYIAVMERYDGRQDSYKLYPDKERPVSELAVLLMEGVSEANIDGLHVRYIDHQFVHVLPGTHVLSGGLRKYGAGTPAGQRFTISVEAGHQYALYARKPRKHRDPDYFWVEDAASGKVVGGTKKP